MLNEPMIDNRHLCCFKNMSWTAIFIGALVGLGISFLLNLFGMAIGLSAVTMTKEGAMTLAIGAFIGMLISAIVSTFATGWVAGFLGRKSYAGHCVGALYGFTAWCIGLIFTLLLASHMSNFISSHFYTMSHPALSYRMDTRMAPSMMNETKEETNKAGTNEMGMTTAEEKNVANVAGKTLFAFFILFLVGALTSCIGGHIGYTRRHECETKINNTRIE